MERKVLAVIFGLLITSTVAFAELEPEVVKSERLPAEAGPHWVWVNDLNIYSIVNGKAYLVDGDSGRFLGMMGLGLFPTKILFPTDKNLLYTTETYYSRGTHGERTDIIGIYDAQELKPIGEIIIPKKRLTGIPTEGHMAITDEDRFIVIYNFTPVQSVTVIDVKARKTLSEIETPGCSLVYPTGSHSFFMICGDGSLMSLQLDDQGREIGRTLTKSAFDPDKDPIEEDGVRLGNRWLFVSREGYIHTFDSNGKELTLSTPWSLPSEDERQASWRVGGHQLIAAHAASQRLFVLMHKGGKYTFWDPAEEIWVYGLEQHVRLQRIKVKHPATAVRVSQDADPLLYTTLFGGSTLDVYDAKTGEHLRTVEELGASPVFLQIP